MSKDIGFKIVSILSLDKLLLKFSKEQKIAADLNTLQGMTDNGKRLYKEYLSKKIANVLLGIMGVIFLLLVAWLMPKEEGQLKDNTIMRNDYGQAEKSVSLVVKSEGMEEEMQVMVEPLHYTKDELDKMAEEVFSYLSGVFLEDNEGETDGFYTVNKDVELPTKIEGYPFEITWESSDYNVIDSNGLLGEEISGNGDSIYLTAELACYEYTWERDFYLQVFPQIKSWKENFLHEVEKTIEELDYTTSEEKTLSLPQTIEGHSVMYEEKTTDTTGLIVILGVVAVGFIWAMPDSNLKEKLVERENQLLSDYAGLVSKLSLYLGAGLSLQIAIMRIVKDKNSSRYYIKELVVVIREMENGISQSRAMERFADRCKLSCYVKLAVLINQNIRKGNNSLKLQLKEEADKAFEERKNIAKKYGEEAGTKLLFPMLLMLVVVMVMIMYPAFISFTV